MFQAVRTKNSDEQAQADNNNVIINQAFDYMEQRIKQGVILHAQARLCFLSLVSASLKGESVSLKMLALRVSCKEKHLLKQIKKIVDSKMLELTTDDTNVYFTKSMYTYL